MFSTLLRKSIGLVTFTAGATPAATSRLCSAALSARTSSSDSTATTKPTAPTILTLSTDFAPIYQQPRQLWIENLDTVAERKRGLIDLHPAVFAAAPRIDVIHQNVEWQRKYRYVSFANTKSRSEVRGGGRKPWPQKGLGRARHGSIRSPLWRGGGIVHGPRSPTTHFYMLPVHQRVAGLVAALSTKLAQNDVHVVDELELPVEDPEYLKQLLAERLWGESVLFVDREDIVSRNVAIATESIPHVHVMPAYGLNVYSLLKYNTLVLTVDAAQHIQEKLLLNMNRTDASDRGRKFQLNQ